MGDKLLRDHGILTLVADNNLVLRNMGKQLMKCIHGGIKTGSSDANQLDLDGVGGVGLHVR